MGKCAKNPGRTGKVCLMGLSSSNFFVLGQAKKDKNNHFNEKNGTAKLIRVLKIIDFL